MASQVDSKQMHFNHVSSSLSTPLISARSSNQ